MMRSLALAGALVATAHGQPRPDCMAWKPDLPSCSCIERQDVRIIAITHGPTAGSSEGDYNGAFDTFWSAVHDGFVTAGANLGVQVEHYAPNQHDIGSKDMDVIFDDLVDKAIAENPDGVVLSIPSNAAVDSALTKLETAGTIASRKPQATRRARRAAKN